MSEQALHQDPQTAPLSERIRVALMARVLGFSDEALPPSRLAYRAQNAAEYDARRSKREIFRWEQEVIRRLLAPLAPESHVLDVPIGTGRFIPAYLSLGLVVTGLDLSPDMLAEAHRTFEPDTDPVTLLLGSATDLPFPDAHFDAVVSFRFLPGKLTLRQARRALREYARVSRGQVHVLLKIGERKFPASWRDEFSCLATRPEHELRQILAEAGLAVDHVERAPTGPKAVFVCHRA